MATERADVVVIGAGHNGLVASLFLARGGLSVKVVEAAGVVGGAVRTEYPFAKAPKLGASTGAYLFGLMPPELLEKMQLELPLKRRDPHYFLPTTSERSLLLGTDDAETKRQLSTFFSAKDWDAHVAMEAELEMLRDDVAKTWLREPLSIEATANRWIRPALRRAFVDLCRGSVGDYLAQWGFESDLVKAMYAVTDGFTGVLGTWDTPGTGMNFLVHNMCRLRGSGGTWMVVEGGMGTVTARIADRAREAGAAIETGRAVTGILVDGNAAKGVVLADGTEIQATTVLCNADPFRMRTLVGADRLPAEYNQRLDGWLRDGSSFKLNVALRGLPRFSCLPVNRGQHGATIHLLPEGDVIHALKAGFQEAREGKLPTCPAIEWYIHTATDPTLKDADGNHSSALFVQWVPYQPAGSTWAAEEERFSRHLLSICDRFAPGTSDLVVDTFALPPTKIESHFGITRGHIHHVDNMFGFADRVPYATPIAGLYSCSAGCHPAGAVIGAAGHNAAQRILADLEARLGKTEIHRPVVPE